MAGAARPANGRASRRWRSPDPGSCRRPPLSSVPHERPDRLLLEVDERLAGDADDDLLVENVRRTRTSRGPGVWPPVGNRVADVDVDPALERLRHRASVPARSIARNEACTWIAGE